MGLSSSLPIALQKQEEQVNKLIQETYPDKKPEEEGKPKEAPTEGGPEKQEKPTQAKEAEKVATVEAKPEEKPAESPAAAPEGFVPKAEYNALEQKHRVLQGKYDAEVPLLHRELRSLKEEVSAIREQPSKTEPEPKAKDKKEMPTDWEERKARLIEEYGEEFLQDMYFNIREQIVKDLDLDGITAKVDTVAKDSAKSRDERYLEDLNKLAPNWRQYVEDPDFAKWMALEEGNTGFSRLDFAKQHMTKRDASRVAKYYTDYMASIEAPKEIAPTPTPDKEKSGEKPPNKETLVAPTATPQGERPTREEEEIPYVTQSEMDKYARDVTRGYYVGREKEAKDIEAKFNRAAASGRIIPG